MPVGKFTDEWLFLSGIDVLASPETGGVVAPGDSLTDANISTHDAYARWPDQLARLLIGRRAGRPVGVTNEGLCGNRVLHDLRGDSGLRRFDRDVLAQPGVTHAIVMLGAWKPVREAHRVTVHDWIRNNGVLDGVVDFDKALRDPERPTQMLPIYDCGDGLHPSDLGYCRMGDAIDLALFD